MESSMQTVSKVRSHVREVTYACGLLMWSATGSISGKNINDQVTGYMVTVARSS